ncbi:TolC family protein [Candidatus Omnitrophota bacterium]
MQSRSMALIFIIVLTNLVAPHTVSGQEQEELHLNIEEVNSLALEHNFDIQVYKLDQKISEEDLLDAQSVYDTTLDGTYEYNEDRLKRASVILGERQVAISESADLSKTLPTGTVLSLGGSHIKQSSDSVFNTLNPYHESEAHISVTQSIGQNFLGIIDRNTVKITGLAVENSGYTSLDKIELELAQTQKAYWNLILAFEDTALTEKILQSAKDLYSAYKRNFDRGMVEEPELFAVEANLRKRQRDVVLANNKLNMALNRIRLKLALARNVVVEPKDDFNPVKLETRFDEVMCTALNNRRDYKVAKNNIISKGLSLSMKKNSLWPEIDITGTLKKNGLNQEFSDSVTEITSDDFPEYTVGVVFSFSLEASESRAEYSKAKLQKAKALIELKKIECQILVQTHDAYMHVKNMFESLHLQKEASELEHKKYMGEKDRFEKGRSNTDTLIRYQEDDLRANLAYLASLYAYEEALIDLKVSINKLLQGE